MNQKTCSERWKKEYIVPLEGKPIFRRKGIIKAVARYGQKVSVGEIIREEFEEEEFQYIIHPYWEIVDGLPASIFQGIPGINMELRQTDYYRVNYEPVFITERSPSKNREDMWELMQDVGLDYYDRFEWLLRTDMRAGNDNLIVEPIYEEQPEPLVDYILRESEDIWHLETWQTNSSASHIARYLKYGDILRVDHMSDLGKTANELTENLFLLAGAGIEIKTEEGWELTREQITFLLPLLWNQIELGKTAAKNRKIRGIQRAKEEKKYKGRKKIEVSAVMMEEICRGLDNGTIGAKEAMERLHLTSRSTFYRRLREYRERNQG